MHRVRRLRGSRVCRADDDCAAGDRCCILFLLDERAGWFTCTSATFCPDPAAATNGVVCGDVTCGNAAVCCQAARFTCTAATGCTVGLAVACDGPEDCAAAAPLCCFDGALSRTSCVAGGGCAEFWQYAVCHASADCAPGELCAGTPIVDTLPLCMRPMPM